MPDDPHNGEFDFEINNATGSAGMNPGWDMLVVSQGGSILQLAPGSGFTVSLISLVGDHSQCSLLNFNPATHLAADSSSRRWDFPAWRA